MCLDLETLGISREPRDVRERRLDPVSGRCSGSQDRFESLCSIILVHYDMAKVFEMESKNEEDRWTRDMTMCSNDWRTQHEN